MIRLHNVTARQSGFGCNGKKDDVDLSGLLTGVIGDRLGDIEGGIFTTHVVGTGAAFRNRFSFPYTRYFSAAAIVIRPEIRFRKSTKMRASLFDNDRDCSLTDKNVLRSCRCTLRYGKDLSRLV